MALETQLQEFLDGKTDDGSAIALGKYAARCIVLDVVHWI